MLTDQCEVFIHGSGTFVQSADTTGSIRMVMGGIVNKKRAKFYTWLIFLSGSLSSISFGMMAGWTSCTYPLLLSDEAPVRITLDQSAMIAGMLLNGFVISSPFVNSECLGSKFGVLLGSGILLSGWLVMIVATNVLLLCISRLLVGSGAAYAIGKFKLYIQEIATEEDGEPLHKYLTLFANTGLILTYIVGPYVSFKMLATVCTVIAGLAFTTFIVTPETPFNLYKQKKFQLAMESLKYIHGEENVEYEAERLKSITESRQEHKSFFQVLRNAKMRKSFFLITFIITIQQFSGGPSVIVYNQIIYRQFQCIYPEICSVLYALIFFCATGLGAKFTQNWCRKPVLVISCLVCSISSVVHACYLYLLPENVNYALVPFFTMILFSFFHTFGLATLPNLILNDIFPENARQVMSCYLNMYTAQLAVIVTKIFQVLYSVYGMHISFCMFSAASVLGFVIFAFSFDETKSKDETNRIT